MKPSVCIADENRIGYDLLIKENYFLTSTGLIKTITDEFFKAFQRMHILSSYFNGYCLLSALKIEILTHNYLPKLLQQMHIAVKFNVNSYIMYQKQTRDVFLPSLISL